MPPTKLRTYHKISLEEFESKVYSSDKELINNIYSGDAFIITGVVDPVYLNEMKQNVIKWGNNREPEYQPMEEGARDFHQYIKEDGASLISIMLILFVTHIFSSDGIKILWGHLNTVIIYGVL